MRHWSLRSARAVSAALAIGIASLFGAASAWAQDYTVTTATDLLESRPAGATKLPLSSVNNDVFTIVDLPFEFPYYGRMFTQFHVNTAGFLVAGPVGKVVNSSITGNGSGRDPTSGAFPYSPSGSVSATGAMVDGLITPMWERYYGVDDAGYPNTGAAYMWIAGNAPARHAVLSWENVIIDRTNAAPVTVQVHLYETTGRVVFAYSETEGGYLSSARYVCGIDSFGDTRFTAPLLDSDQNSGYPGSDFIFDPRAPTITGRLLYDKLVSDSSGIGNTVATDRSLGGLRLEVRRDNGILANFGYTAADGSFSIPALAVASNSSGALNVIAQGKAVRVSTSGNTAATQWTVDSSLDFSGSTALGTQRLTSSNDSGAAIRGALNVALACDAARAWAASRTTDTIPLLDAAYDAASAAPTSYDPNGPYGKALLVIGSPSSPNPDAWDDAIVTKAYARALLQTVTGVTPAPYDGRFDAVTDPQIAFAEGFGYALWAAVSGSTTAVDGLSASAANVYDLESPTLSAARGPDHAGAVAAALFDMIDGANETIDVVDGTSTADRFFQIVDAAAVRPNIDVFEQGWIDRGHEPIGMIRALIGNGAVVDDAKEPNDSAAELAGFVFGSRLDNLVLHRFNDDWYAVSPDQTIPSLVVDLVHDRTAGLGTASLELLNGGGTVIATGAGVGTTGPIRLATGPLGAGAYRIGIRHTGGPTIGTYRLQAYAPLATNDPPFRNWTVGRPYDESLGIGGGIAPYTITTVGPPLPPGLFASAQTLRGGGTPTTAGSYTVQVQVRDDGNPANVVLRNQTIVIAPPMDLALANFVGFPLGREIDEVMTFSGGTAPRTLAIRTNGLPEGLTLDGATFRVSGTANAVGSTAPIRLEASDVTGSIDEVTTTPVVCPQGAPKNVPLDLAAGEAACGMWIDAVRGSTLKFTAKTPKGQVKRLLDAVVLAPDRSVVVGGKVREKLGTASGSGIRCTESGRYYVVFASAEGPDTQILAGVTAAAAKSGKAKFPEFDPASTTAVEFGALPGARLVFKANGDKKKGLRLRCAGLVGPDGSLVDLSSALTETATGFVLAIDLPVGGTWKVLVAARPGSANAGKASCTYTTKAPKGAAYAVD